jgi:hypothetical protein
MPREGPQQLDDGKVRYGEPGWTEEAACGRRQATCVFAAGHGGEFQGGELRAEVAAGNPVFKKFLDSLTAYSSNGYRWFQVAEVGYDNFMARHLQS